MCEIPQGQNDDMLLMVSPRVSSHVNTEKRLSENLSISWGGLLVGNRAALLVRHGESLDTALSDRLLSSWLSFPVTGLSPEQERMLNPSTTILIAQWTATEHSEFASCISTVLNLGTQKQRDFFLTRQPRLASSGQLCFSCPRTRITSIHSMLSGKKDLSANP